MRSILILTLSLLCFETLAEADAPASSLPRDQVIALDYADGDQVNLTVGELTAALSSAYGTPVVISSIEKNFFTLFGYVRLMRTIEITLNSVDQAECYLQVPFDQDLIGVFHCLRPLGSPRIREVTFQLSKITKVVRAPYLEPHRQ